MPEVAALKNILKRVEQQIKTLQGGLRHIAKEESDLEDEKSRFERYFEKEKQRIQKKKSQFDSMMRMRTKDSENIKEQIQNIQKIQMKEGGIDTWFGIGGH